MEEIKGICVDSDILVDYLRGVEKARRFLLEKIASGPIYVSVVSIAEIYSGKDTADLDKRKMLDEFLAQFQAITVTPSLAKCAGEVRRDYLKPFADAIVAASAIEYKLTLATRNAKHFRSIKGLKIVSPY